MRLRFIAALAVSTIAAVFICSGCGSTAVLQIDPMSLFEQGKQSMQGTSSVQMEMAMVVTIDYKEGVSKAFMREFGKDDGEELSSTNIKFQSERTEDGSWVVRLSMKPGGAFDNASPDMTMYIVGDRYYYEVRGEWYYYDYAGLADLQSGYQGMTPEKVPEMMEYSDNVEVAGENRDSIDYELTLGQRYLDHMMEGITVSPNPLMEKARQNIESTIKLFEGAVFEITIDKESGLPTAGRLTLQIELPDFVRMVDPEAKDPTSADLIEGGEGSFIVMDFEYAFLNYGMDFGISLPEEAAEARPLPVSNL